jgi:hypothetical protein
MLNVRCQACGKLIPTGIDVDEVDLSVFSRLRK